MAKDKVTHFIAGVIMMMLFGVLFGPWWGFFLAVAIGAAKEVVWDMWLKKGTPEWMDFVATFVGALVILPIYLFLP